MAYDTIERLNKGIEELNQLTADFEKKLMERKALEKIPKAVDGSPTKTNEAAKVVDSVVKEKAPAKPVEEAWMDTPDKRLKWRKQEAVLEKSWNGWEAGKESKPKAMMRDEVWNGLMRPTTSVKACKQEGAAGGSSGSKQSTGGKAQATSKSACQAKAQSLSDAKAFNTEEYVRATARDGAIQESLDAALASERQGKKLMQMLLQAIEMLQRDPGLHTIYHFLRVLNVINAKSESIRLIRLGKEMIRMNQLEMAYTNKLINFNGDPSNPNTGNELMKLHTWVKSETDAIATVQKLLASSIETAAQNIETGHNWEKGALDALGRVMRKISSF